MQSTTTLVIGANSEFGASLNYFFDGLGDQAVCLVEGDFDKGLEVLANRRPDLVLIDASLIDAEDKDTVKTIRVQHPAAKIYLLTIFDRDLYRRNARLLGVDGVVSREKFAEEFGQLNNQLRDRICVRLDNASQ